MRLGIVGYGTVGQGVADLLARHADRYARLAGAPVEARAILVRNTDAHRDVPPPGGALYTDDPDAFFGAPFDCLVEVAGGIDPARSYVARALESGREVVTANKSLIAAHGDELFAIAEARRLRIAFEAAVAGGVPIVASLVAGLGADRVRTIDAILNGTCNFVLSRMESEGVGAPAAIAEAQRLGFAEADPTLDVSGRDSAEKLAILATLCLGAPVHPDDIPTRGITDLDAETVALARELGGAVRLLARADLADRGSPRLRVEPVVVPLGHDLARVEASFNAVALRGEAAGETFLKGAGAGRFPTAGAVVADALRLATSEPHAGAPANPWPVGAERVTPSTAETPARRFVRFALLHHDGGYDALRDALREAGVGVERLHETPDSLALTTEPVERAAVERAIAERVADGLAPDDRVTLPFLDEGDGP